MAFIPAPPGVCRVRTIWSFTGLATAENVMYFDTGTGAVPNAAELGSVATAFETAWGVGAVGAGTVLGNLAADCAITEIDVEDASSATGPFAHITENAPGRASGSALPPGVASVCTWFTGLRGRSFRGRTFLPGLPEGNVGPSGDINTPLFTTLAAAWQAFLGSVKNPGAFPTGTLVVASYHSGVDPTTKRPIPRPVAVVTPVTGVQLRGHVHSQRRRNQRD